MTNSYSSSGRHKWYLKCHLIFVCKYRKRLLEGQIQNVIKNIFADIVRKLKQESTRELWKRYPDWLRCHFWKEHTFWNDGYFVCSIGEASPETIRKYIENQG